MATGQISKTKYTSQYIHNMSFDDDFKLQVFELVAHDPITDTVKKVTLDALNHYSTNDIDTPDVNTLYEGLQDSDENWQIVKSVKNLNQSSFRFATIKNNNTYTTYSDAWIDRATLSYDYYGVAF